MKKRYFLAMGVIVLIVALMDLPAWGAGPKDSGDLTPFIELGENLPAHNNSSAKPPAMPERMEKAML